MFEFHEKRKIRSVLYSRAMLIFLGVLVLLVVYVALGAIEKKQETTERREELTGELGRLEKRVSELEGDIGRLNDPRGIELELRNRYVVGREGEEVIVLVEEEVPVATVAPEIVVEKEKGSFWGRFFGTLF